MDKVVKKDKHGHNLDVEDEKIASLSAKLLEVLEEEKKKDLIDKGREVLHYPGVKEVLTILGLGSYLVLAAAAPGLSVLTKGVLYGKSSRDWKKYNQWYLLRTLKRLKKEKMVEWDFVGDKIVIKLSNKGKQKILSYSLRTLAIRRPNIWDGKWRLIIYDVPYNQRGAADNFSRFLINLGMYRLQKSVFLYPFPCQNEVEFLREFFGVGDYVWSLRVDHFENDKVFRDYFGL